MHYDASSSEPSSSGGEEDDGRCSSPSSTGSSSDDGGFSTGSTPSSSSDGDDVQLEAVTVQGRRAHVPQGLCEDADIFRDFFSEHTWNNISAAGRSHLLQFLPAFPGERSVDITEKDETLHRLFARETFRFCSPFDNFYEHLRAGHYRPDIARIRRHIRRAELKEAKWRHRRYREQLDVDLKASRDELFELVAQLPPGSNVRQRSRDLEDTAVRTNNERVSSSELGSNSLVNGLKSSERIERMVRKRYYQELQAIKSKVGETGFSSDDTDGGPGGMNISCVSSSYSLTKKQRKHVGILHAGLRELGAVPVCSTHVAKTPSADLERSVFGASNPFVVTEESYRAMLDSHRKLRKSSKLVKSEPNITPSLEILDIIHRARLNYKKLPIAPVRPIAELKPAKRKANIDGYRSLSPELLRLSQLQVSQSTNAHTEPESDSDLDRPSSLGAPLSKVPRTMLKRPSKTEKRDKITVMVPPMQSQKILQEQALPMMTAVVKPSQADESILEVINDTVSALDVVATISEPVISPKHAAVTESPMRSPSKSPETVEVDVVEVEEDETIVSPSNPVAELPSRGVARNGRPAIGRDEPPMTEPIIEEHVDVEIVCAIEDEPTPIVSIFQPIESTQTVSSSSPPAIITTLPVISTVEISSSLSTKVQIQAVDSSKTYRTATLSDLDGIDMESIPFELDESEILDLNRPVLRQETHSSFLALIRDVICSSSDYRMGMLTLSERLRAWQDNPISPLNDWYSLCESWLDVLLSAVNFLSGNFHETPDDFVPYLEYKPVCDLYQWIGAGRDSDASLYTLFKFWLDHRNSAEKSSAGKRGSDGGADERNHQQQTPPPPPRYPTTWSVVKADVDDVRRYREQEKQRYDSPHKSFTYRCNGYESVVGPVKGIYNSAVPSNTKARGHTMLSADRPNFVTILSLVRDAAARLPNGEGTRAEICELLKSSQYISSTALDNVLQSVVSGALDRMHTQTDPCVKYDPKRKIWIYLHRHRTEEDFERIHKQLQNSTRTTPKKPARPKPPSSHNPKSKSSPEATTKAVTAISNNVSKATTTTTAVSSVGMIECIGSNNSAITLTTSAGNNVEKGPVITSQLVAVAGKPSIAVSKATVNANSIVIQAAKSLLTTSIKSTNSSDTTDIPQLTTSLGQVVTCNASTTLTTATMTLSKPVASSSTPMPSRTTTTASFALLRSADSPGGVVKDGELLKPTLVSISVPASAVVTDGGKLKSVRISNRPLLTTLSAQPPALVTSAAIDKSKLSPAVTTAQSLSLLNMTKQGTIQHQSLIAKPVVTVASSAHAITPPPSKTITLSGTTSILAAQKQQHITLKASTVVAPGIVSMSSPIFSNTTLITTTDSLATATAVSEALQAASTTAGEIITTTVTKKLPDLATKTISAQQFQSIKNITLLRNAHNVSGGGGGSLMKPVVTIGGRGNGSPTPTVTTMTETNLDKSTPTITSNTLLTAATMPIVNRKPQVQQSVLLSQAGAKQKNMQIPIGLNAAHPTTIGTPSSVILKPKNLAAKSALGTQFGDLGNKPSGTPLVAKVLTNAAGQVISVESLLAHQKQHGTLPQGTTLRVTSSKGATNIIQLASPLKATPTAQGTISQSSLLSLATQTKFVLATGAVTPSTATMLGSSSASVPVTSSSANAINKPIVKAIVKQLPMSHQATLPRFPAKIGQQIINARFVTSDPNMSSMVTTNTVNSSAGKAMPQKLIMSNSGSISGNTIHLNPKTGAVAGVTLKGSSVATANAIRMISAGNLNMATIGNKPVLIANKANNFAGGNIIIQTAMSSSSTTSTGTMSNITGIDSNHSLAPQQLILSQHPQLMHVKNAALGPQVQNTGAGAGSSVLLGGQQVRLQQSGSTMGTSTQRLVLASQGQGGQLVAQQIILPANLQGTPINIKSLQGVKVIPIGQTPKGISGQILTQLANQARAVSESDKSLNAESKK